MSREMDGHLWKGDNGCERNGLSLFSGAAYSIGNSCLFFSNLADHTPVTCKVLLYVSKIRNKMIL